MVGLEVVLVSFVGYVIGGMSMVVLSLGIFVFVFGLMGGF